MRDGPKADTDEAADNCRAVVHVSRYRRRRLGEPPIFAAVSRENTLRQATPAREQSVLRAQGRFDALGRAGLLFRRPKMRHSFHIR